MISTKNQARPESITRLSLRQLRENAGKYAAADLSYLAMGLLGIALMFLSGSLGFLSIPFITIPFAFAASGCMAAISKGGDLSNAAFFSGYRAYFLPPYQGSYRVIWSYVKAFFIGTVLSSFLSMLVAEIFAGVYPTFEADLASAAEMLMGLDASIVDFIGDSESLRLFVLTIGVIETGIVSVIYVMFLVAEAPNPFFRNTAKGFNGNGIKALKRLINEKSGGSLRKDYLKAVWPVYLLLPLFFAAAAAAAYFVPVYNADVVLKTDFCLSCGSAGLFLCTVIVLPYVSLVSSNLADKYQRDFMSAAYDLSKRAIDMAEMQRRAQEDALRQMQRELDEARRENEEAKEKLNPDGGRHGGTDGGDNQGA